MYLWWKFSRSTEIIFFVFNSLWKLPKIKNVLTIRATRKETQNKILRNHWPSFSIFSKQPFSIDFYVAWNRGNTCGDTGNTCATAALVGKIRKVDEIIGNKYLVLDTSFWHCSWIDFIFLCILICILICELHFFVCPYWCEIEEFKLLEILIWLFQLLSSKDIEFIEVLSSPLVEHGYSRN